MAPNIVLFFPDEYRWDWTGYLNRVPVRTPNLDALAARGTAFTSAICPSPLCCPSRAALAGGVEYPRCGVPHNNASYIGTEDGLYRLLQAAGYHTMGCGKFHLGGMRHSCGRDGKQRRDDGTSWFDEWGFSDGLDSGWKKAVYSEYPKGNVGPYMAYLEERGLAQVHVDDFAKRRPERFQTHVTPLPDDAYVDNWIARTAIGLVDSVPPDVPFFLQVNFCGPHQPWDVTQSMLSSCEGIEYPPPLAPDETMSLTKINEVRRNYAAMIENIDREIGRIIDHLKKNGVYENTLFIVSSDHGEMLGDRGCWRKSVPWQASVGVPLLFSGPGVQHQPLVTTPTESLDIAATCLDFANIAAPGSWDSRSLRLVLEGRTDRVREVALSGLGPWSLVTDGRYKLIRTIEKDGNELLELYDLGEDPAEVIDVADARPEMVRRLILHLDAHKWPRSGGGD